MSPTALASLKHIFAQKWTQNSVKLYTRLLCLEWRCIAIEKVVDFRSFSSTFIRQSIVFRMLYNIHSHLCNCNSVLYNIYNQVALRSLMFALMFLIANTVGISLQRSFSVLLFNTFWKKISWSLARQDLIHWLFFVRLLFSCIFFLFHQLDAVSCFHFRQAVRST